MRKLVPLFLLLIPVLASAQDSEKKDENNATAPSFKNAIKVNLSSLAIRNYHIQYERQIARRWSVNLGVRIMPKGGLPLEKTFRELLPEVFEDPNLDVGRFKMGSTAFTLEPRFYLGKGAMKGFYIAPYARYSTFDLSFPLKYEYTETSTGTTYNKEALFSGKVNAFSGGLMLGTQFNLGKRVVLDIWWIGAHYGSSSGDLGFTPTTPFTNDEQNAIRETVEDFDASPFKFEPTVTANKATIKSDGPWAGVRGLGINLGFRF